MRQRFEADILEKDFKPAKFTNELNFWLITLSDFLLILVWSK